MPKYDKNLNPTYPKTPYYNEEKGTPTDLDFAMANYKVGPFLDTASLDNIKDLKRFYTDVVGTPKQVKANDAYRERNLMGFDPYGMSDRERATYNLIDEAHRDKFPRDYFNFYAPSFESSSTRTAKPVVPEMSAGGMLKNNIKKYNFGGDLLDAYGKLDSGEKLNLAGDVVAGTDVSGFARAKALQDYYSDIDVRFRDEEDPFEVDEKAIREGYGEAREQRGESIGGTAGATVGTVVGTLLGSPTAGAAVGSFLGKGLGKLLSGIKGKKYKQKVADRIQAEKDQAFKEKGEYVDIIQTADEETAMRSAAEQSAGIRSNYIRDIQTKLNYLKYGGTLQGVVSGPSHEEGGVVVTKNGQAVAEVEGEEYVTNAKITQNSPESKNIYEVKGTPLQILSKLNSINNYGDATHPGGVIKRLA